MSAFSDWRYWVVLIVAAIGTAISAHHFSGGFIVGVCVATAYGMEPKP